MKNCRNIEDFSLLLESELKEKLILNNTNVNFKFVKYLLYFCYDFQPKKKQYFVL